jgi:hypothetical protein
LRRREEVDAVEIILVVIQVFSLGSGLIGLLGYLNSPAVITVGCTSYLLISDVCIKGVPFFSVAFSLFTFGVTALVGRLRRLYLDLVKKT